MKSKLYSRSSHQQVMEQIDQAIEESLALTKIAKANVRVEKYHLHYLFHQQSVSIYCQHKVGLLIAWHAGDGRQYDGYARWMLSDLRQLDMMYTIQGSASWH